MMGADGEQQRTPDRARAVTRGRVLLVEDDEAALRAIERLFREEGFATSTVQSGEAALEEARRMLPDLVLTDRHMPGMDGIELCRRLHEIDRDLPVIVMTGDSDMRSVLESLRAGAEDYLTKPLQLDAVAWTVTRAIARRASRREEREVQRKLNERLVLSSIREQELAESEWRQRVQLTALLENLSEGVAIGDADGRLIMLNETARSILGADEPTVCDLEGRPLLDHQHPFARAVRGESFEEYEVAYPRTNGERRRVVFTGTSVMNARGEVELAIIVFRDVTKLRRLEQHRDEYLSLVSHDLRNPMSVILFSLETLKGSLSADRKSSNPVTSPLELVERAQRNVRRMNAMLDELRESTTLEASSELERAPCDLRQIVASVMDTIDDERARRIMIERHDDAPYRVLADAARLERVVANLVTNALKYSATDAPVTLRFTRNAGMVELDVVDRGIGIAPESVSRLFERYFRTPAGKARASGLGLGLYIARLIAEAHGGRLEVSSQVAAGSTFKLVLPSLASTI